LNAIYTSSSVEEKGGRTGIFRSATPIFFSIGILLILSVVGCDIRFGKKKSDEESETAAPVTLTTVERGDISSFLRLNGYLEADREVEVFARTIGRVVKLTVEEGDRVTAGQLLARIDDSEQKLALERARAAVQRETSACDRAEELFGGKMLSEDEYEQVRLAVQDAELNLQQAELSLEYTRITAPFTGTIAERMIDLGDQVDLSRPLFEIVDVNILHIHGWVAETDLPYLKVGQEAAVVTRTQPEDPAVARIVRISPVVDPTYGKVKVTFEISGSGNEIRPGQFVELQLTINTHRDVMLIPKKALIYEVGVPVVFQARDSLALRRPIELGLESGDVVELCSGLTPGDSIIIEGQATLRDSSRIRVIEK